MLSPRIRTGSGVLGALLFLLFAGMASAAPCCVVTAIDAASGTVTAEETSTGASFEFKVLKRQLGTLQVGSPLDADLDARVVIFGDRSIAMRKLTRARRPNDEPEAEVSAEVQDSPDEETLAGETDGEPRQRDAERNQRARSKVRKSSSSSAEEQEEPSTIESDQPDAERSQVTEERSQESEELSAGEPEGRNRRAPVKRRQKSREPQESDPSEKRLRAVPASDSQQTSAIRSGRKNPTLPPSAPPPPKCYVGGCSGQVCSGMEGVITTCEYRPEYQCYQSAECKRQPNGACGWTPTQTLTACLSAAGAQ